jgi:Spy/CpxP family protein refolding chaperone
MKKTILAIAALAIFTVSNSFAQYSPANKVYNKPQAVKTYYADNTFEEYNINQLDNIVKLTRSQQNEIKQIENRYDRLAANSRRNQTQQSIKRLELQKQQDILSVLTPNQTQRLLAYEQGNKYGRNANRSNRRG